VYVYNTKYEFIVRKHLSIVDGMRPLLYAQVAFVKKSAKVKRA